MDKRLIGAAILSLVGAGYMAVSLGLSLYTIAFLPAFIIVLVFNIRDGQKAKAVWLGFLLYLIATLLPSRVDFLFSPVPGLVMPVLLLHFAILVLAFMLVFVVFSGRRDTSHLPNRRLAVLAGSLLLVSVVVAVEEVVSILIDIYRVTGRLGYCIYDSWSTDMLRTPFWTSAAIGISVLLFRRERFTFYIVAPIFLVLDLLLVLGRIFHFSIGHLSPQSFFELVTTPFKITSGVGHLFYDVYAVLTLIAVVYFLKYYTNGSESHTKQAGTYTTRT